MEIPIYKPELPDYELVEPDIRETFETGMLYPGKFTERLTEALKEYTGASYILPVSSCSTGLMVLASLIRTQGRVIIPAFTFNATLQAVEWSHQEPVAVDVDDDGQLRPDLVREYMENSDVPVVGAIPVHMWGNACYPQEFHSLYLPVIFDGAHVFGTRYKDQDLSKFGDAVVYSIAATKPLSAGEGGIIATNDRRVFEMARHVTFHGLYNSLDTRLVGLNGKIQEFNSILAFHALTKFEETKRKRAERMEQYRSAFVNLPLRIWKVHQHVDPSYKDCVIFLDSRVKRDALEVFLNKRGIGTKRYFDPAIPDMGSFTGIDAGCPNARKLSATCLTLPLYPALTDSEMEYIINGVHAFFQ